MAVTRLRPGVSFSGVRAAIYDKDDTMVRSEPLHAIGWNAEFRKLGSKLRYEDIPADIRKTWPGKPELVNAQSMIDYLKLQTTASELVRGKAATFKELIKTVMEMMPGLIESLDFFRSIDFKIAMATSSDREQVELVLDRFNLRKYFDVLVSTEDITPGHGKPHPEMYSITAQKLEVPPQECVALEDATSGVKSAGAANMLRIGIPSHNEPQPPQDLSEADAEITSLDDVSALDFRRPARIA